MNQYSTQFLQCIFRLSTGLYFMCHPYTPYNTPRPVQSGWDSGFMRHSRVLSRSASVTEKQNNYFPNSFSSTSHPLAYDINRKCVLFGGLRSAVCLMKLTRVVYHKGDGCYIGLNCTWFSKAPRTCNPCLWFILCISGDLSRKLTFKQRFTEENGMCWYSQTILWW